MHKILEVSLQYQVLVLVLTALLIASGINSMLKLPIDAVPDVTPNQVQVLTQAVGLSPLEVELKDRPSRRSPSRWRRFRE